MEAIFFGRIRKEIKISDDIIVRKIKTFFTSYKFQSFTIINLCILDDDNVNNVEKKIIPLITKINFSIISNPPFLNGKINKLFVKTENIKKKIELKKDKGYIENSFCYNYLF